ncbi:MAG: PHP domain-containing protein [Propionibacteriaceae bacterium]|jgi:error-prone DNA polymerase|nr:PHP domain-containing protein [Propionibacteriaceae bacterium]
MAAFTHLHVASAHSAHHGTAWPDQLAQAAAADGATALALTDRDGLYGAARHIAACRQAGLDPIVGADLTVLAQDQPPSQITVLAHGHDGGAGWASLARLISAAHNDRRADGPPAPADARRRPVGLAPDRPAAFLLGPDQPTGTVLVGPDSDVGQALRAGRRQLAESRLRDWSRRLGPALAVELVCHHTRPGAAASLSQAAELFELARHCGLEAVLSNAVRYLAADDAITGDVLDAADRLQPLGSFAPQPNGQAWLKPAALMARIAADIAAQAGRPQAGAELLESTERLAQRCRIDPEGDIGWKRPKLPELSVLGLRGDPGRLLDQRCRRALPELYPGAGRSDRERLRQRLELELGTIAGFGFESYFLTVADVVDLIRRLGVRVQARGSGAASLVNYLLGVSSVDPLAHDLVFERFLGRDRSTLPDIDLDVESARRHDIYRAVFARYGQHRVALLSMTNRYRSRGAARDAGLALGLSEAQIDRFATDRRHRTEAPSPAPSDRAELSQLSGPDRAHSRLDLLADLSQRLDRLPRHLSVHPCGVILGDAQLLSLTPVQPSGIGLPMSQFDQTDIDRLGLLKLDVLGVKMQSALAYARDEIVRLNGPRAAAAGALPADVDYIDPSGLVDLERLPHDDLATFETIRSTHTLGLSQIESPGQRELIGRLQPDRYEDLIADLALFRPGPMLGDMVTPYLEAKHGWRQPDPIHPRFQSFLRDSHGVVIYHEQVLRILRDCMDVSLDRADQLRRALATQPGPIEAAFRRATAARLDQQGQRLFDDRQIDRIWAVLAGFGGFGFCKAHAAAIACTTWQSAWLKTHYPAEFLAALFEHDPGMYPRRLLVAEARRLGVPVLPLDANASSDHYRVEWDANGGKAIRLSFRDVLGVTTAEIDRILTGQPYDSILDFISRAHPSRRLAARLASVGVFDRLTDPERPLSRDDIVAYVRRLTAPGARLRHPANQPPLLTDDLALVLRDPPPAQPRLFDDGPAPEPDPNQRTLTELAILSTEIDQHVIDCYDPLLSQLQVTRADRLLELRNGSEVLVAGARVATRATSPRSGGRVVFVSLDDGSGCSDCVFFSQAQRQAGSGLFAAPLLLVRGRTRRTGARGVSLQADQAWDLKQVWRDWRRSRSPADFSLAASTRRP